MSPFFQYEALSKSGVLERGAVMATDPADARLKLRRTGLMSVLSLDPVDTLKKRSVSLHALQDTLGSLAILIKAGLPLLSALQSVSARARSGAVRSALLSMSGAVESGQSLTDAAAATGMFPNRLLASLRVGEETGRLAETLARAADALARENAFRRRMEGLLMYPCIVFSVAMFVIGFLVAFVVPKLTVIFEGSTQALPIPTRVLLGVSTFIQTAGPALALVLTVSLVGALIFFKTPAGLRFRDETLLKIRAVRKIVLARWLGAIAVLLESGVDLVRALDISKDSGANFALEPVIADLGEGVRRGRSFTALMQERPVFADIPMELLAAGESGGQLRSACAACSTALEEEAARELERFATILEPALLLMLGVLTAGIVISVLLPIQELTRAVR